MPGTSKSSLFLCGESRNLTTAQTGSLITILADLGLITCETDPKTGECSTAYAYPAGDNFYHLISLLGCSPALLLDTQEVDDLAQTTQVVVGPALQNPVLVYGRNTPTPSCPACGEKLVNWREQIPSSQSLTEFVCASCGATANPVAIFKNKYAAFVNFYIEITNIFPREAVPTDRLLTTLEQQAGQKIRYCYCEQPLRSYEQIQT